jgi:hypothetical protein
MVRGAGRSTTGRVSLYYADLPVLFQYQITEKFYLDAGPVLSYRLMARSYSFSQQQQVNMTKGVEPFNIGASAGVGYFITTRLALHTSFYRSFTKAWDVSFRDENNQPNGTLLYYPGNFSLGIEYYFKRE